MARPLFPSHSSYSSESVAVMTRPSFNEPISQNTRKSVSGPLVQSHQQQQQQLQLQLQQQRLCVSGPLFPDVQVAAPSNHDAQQQRHQQAGPSSSFATTPLAELWWGVAPSPDAMAVAEAVWGAQDGHPAQHRTMLAPHPSSPSFAASPSNLPLEAAGAAAGCWEWAEAGAVASAADEEEVSSTYRGDGCNRAEIDANCGVASQKPLAGQDVAAQCVCGGGDGYNSPRCLCAMGMPHLAVPQGFDVEGWTTSCDMDDDVASVADEEDGGWGESECGPSGEVSSADGGSWWLGSNTDYSSAACGADSCAVAC